LRRYTSDPHYAGNGYDKLSAVTLKNEWEAALGLPCSGASENFYEAGSAESQARVRGKKDLGVWIDTVSQVSIE
jgi:N-acetylated-alpha-linked acidic dipeptidase